MCLHTVASENLQFVRYDFAHRNGRSTLLSQHQSDLNVLPALAQIADGIATGSGMSESIQGNVSATFGNFDDGLGNIGDLPSIHSGNRAQRACQTKLVVGNIYRHNVGAYRVGNHNRRQTHTTTPVDGYPLSGGGLSLIYDRAKGGCKSTTETGSRRKIKRLRQANKIRVSMVKGNILGK